MFGKIGNWDKFSFNHHLTSIIFITIVVTIMKNSEIHIKINALIEVKQLFQPPYWLENAISYWQTLCTILFETNPFIHTDILRFSTNMRGLHELLLIIGEIYLFIYYWF